MSVYFIADLHFGHEKMAKFRGFNSIEEHDEYIIHNWNKVVKDSNFNIIYVLGDITNDDASYYKYLNKLNGMKKVVAGNHDILEDSKKLISYVNGITGAVKYQNKYLLTHIPVHPTSLDKNIINIHGHTHKTIINRFYS